jgi:hypothetical protein
MFFEYGGWRVYLKQTRGLLCKLGTAKGYRHAMAAQIRSHGQD